MDSTGEKQFSRSKVWHRLFTMSRQQELYNEREETKSSSLVEIRERNKQKIHMISVVKAGKKEPEVAIEGNLRTEAFFGCKLCQKYLLMNQL